jgi:hypothetical protein
MTLYRNIPFEMPENLSLNFYEVDVMKFPLVLTLENI